MANQVPIGGTEGAAFACDVCNILGCLAAFVMQLELFYATFLLQRNTPLPQGDPGGRAP